MDKKMKREILYCDFFKVCKLPPTDFAAAPEPLKSFQGREDMNDLSRRPVAILRWCRTIIWPPSPSSRF